MIFLFLRKECFEQYENFSACSIAGIILCIVALNGVQARILIYRIYTSEKTKKLIKKSEVQDKVSLLVKDFRDTYCQSALRFGYMIKFVLSLCLFT